MRPAGPPIGTERACRADFPCCRVSAEPQAVPVAHGLPPGTHSGLCTGRKSAQTGRPSPLSPRRIPKIPPEKRLERRRMSFRPASSARHGKSPPEGDADAPAPCSELTEKQGRGFLFFASRPPAGPATRQTDDSANRRIGETLPAQDSPLPDALLLPRTSVKARERACLAPPPS